MLNQQVSSLRSYIHNLQVEGRNTFTAEEAKSAIGISQSAFLAAAERLQRRTKLLKIRQGFYVVIPPFFESWGAPEPFCYIDALMDYQKEPYYIALLKAACFYGATHQAVMEFQVISEKRMPTIYAGRHRIVFYNRKSIKNVSIGIEERHTSSGVYQVSSPELTALDLVRYPLAAAGLDNIMTVLTDMGNQIKPKLLAKLSCNFERPVVQILGFFLDSLGFTPKTNKMHKELTKRSKIPWTELNQRESRTGHLITPPKFRNDKWKVIVRRMPEPDE